MSRKELAERVDVNPQTIGFLERGDYNPTVVRTPAVGPTSSPTSFGTLSNPIPAL